MALAECIEAVGMPMYVLMEEQSILLAVQHSLAKEPSSAMDEGKAKLSDPLGPVEYKEQSSTSLTSSDEDDGEDEKDQLPETQMSLEQSSPDNQGQAGDVSDQLEGPALHSVPGEP